MNKFRQIVLIGMFSCMTFDVMALPLISGSIDMFGPAPSVYDKDDNIALSAADAVKIDFDPNIFLVIDAKGDLSVLDGQVGDVKDLTFAPDPFVAIDDFWTVGGFTFDLLTVVRDASNDPSSFLMLNGTGVISDGNVEFEDTAATWSFSADTSGNSLFAWNAVSATSVPEPSALMLLAIGLIGIGLRKRI